MRVFYVLLLGCFLLVTGCSTVTEAGYYWGDYSTTLYKYTDEPSEETLAAHVEALNDIIEISSEKGLRVPPGIYAELGYISAKKGEDTTSKGYFDAEVQNYPESQPFIERLISVNKKDAS